MKLVMRGNKQMCVADERLEEFLKSGYVELDEKTGKAVPVEKPDRKDTAALKKENKELTEQVVSLAAQLMEQQERADDLQVRVDQLTEQITVLSTETVAAAEAE